MKNPLNTILRRPKSSPSGPNPLHPKMLRQRKQLSTMWMVPSSARRIALPENASIKNRYSSCQEEVQGSCGPCSEPLVHETLRQLSWIPRQDYPSSRCLQFISAISERLLQSALTPKSEMRTTFHFKWYGSSACTGK